MVSSSGSKWSIPSLALLICGAAAATVWVCAGVFARPAWPPRHSTDQVAQMAETQSNKSVRMVWVPLDSRPVNTREIILLSQAAGMEAILPPAELMDKYVEQQASFEGLLDWLTRTVQPDDQVVIYANSLIFGGLISSRHASAYDGLDGRLTQVQEQLQRLPRSHRILVHVLPRVLPPTLLANGEPNPDYQWRVQLLEWSRLSDQLNRSGSAATRDKLMALEKSIPRDTLDGFRSVVRNSEKVVDSLISWTAEGSADEVIIGIDDAQPSGLYTSLHVAVDAKAAAANVSAHVHRDLGADEIGALIVARTALQRSAVTPHFRVEYQSAEAKNAIFPYEGAPLKASVDQKVRFLQAVDDSTGRQRILILTDTSGEDPTGVGRIIASAQQAIKHGEGVTVVDVTSTARRDTDFLAALGKAVPLGMVNYSSWNTASNSLGTGLAMAAIREIYAQQGVNRDQVGAFLTYQAIRYSHDVIYQRERARLEEWAKRQGIDPWRFGPRRPEIAEKLDEEAAREASKLLDEVFTTTRIQLDGQSYSVCPQKVEMRFPWDRAFEVDVLPVLRLEARKYCT